MSKFEFPAYFWLKGFCLSFSVNLFWAIKIPPLCLKISLLSYDIWCKKPLPSRSFFLVRVCERTWSALSANFLALCMASVVTLYFWFKSEEASPYLVSKTLASWRKIQLLQIWIFHVRNFPQLYNQLKKKRINHYTVQFHNT